MEIGMKFTAQNSSTLKVTTDLKISLLNLMKATMRVCLEFFFSIPRS